MYLFIIKLLVSFVQSLSSRDGLKKTTHNQWPLKADSRTALVCLREMAQCMPTDFFQVTSLLEVWKAYYQLPPPNTPVLNHTHPSKHCHNPRPHVQLQIYSPKNDIKGFLWLMPSPLRLQKQVRSLWCPQCLCGDCIHHHFLLLEVSNQTPLFKSKGKCKINVLHYCQLTSVPDFTSLSAEVHWLNLNLPVLCPAGTNHGSLISEFCVILWKMGEC